MFDLFQFIAEHYKLYLAGAGSTVLISFFTVIFGVIFGVLCALMKMSRNSILRSISTAFIEIVRGTPLLVQIMILFYGLPMILQEYGIRFPEINLMGIDLVAFVSVIIALTINSTAYIAEIIRGGIQSIDKGQMEAARCLGLSHKLAMKKIIIPQAIKNILPALGNEFITVIKESAIVSVVGIKEIMFNAKVITGMTYQVFIPYITAAIVYFILTFGLSKVLAYAERRMKVSD